MHSNRTPKPTSGYAFETTQHWQESSDEDWDTIMYTPTSDEKFVGVRRIDDSRFNVWKAGHAYVAQLEHMTRNATLPRPRPKIDTSLSRVARLERAQHARERPFDPEARYPRETKRHHFAINPTDPRDVPHNLRAVRVSHYRDDPKFNGERVSYDTFENGTAAEGEPEWYEVEDASGSDYSGGVVARANYNAISEELAEHHPEDQKPVAWVSAYGGHNTKALFVVYDEIDDEIKEIINGLTDYPVVSDAALSELESEEEQESWDNFYRREFERAVVKAVNAEYPDDEEVDDWPEDTEPYTLLRMAMDASNTYWEHTSEGPYLDLKRVVPVAVEFITGARQERGNSIEDHEELEKIRAGFQLQLDPK